MLRIGWFSTGRGEGSRGLLRLAQEQISQGKLNARIEFVFSNREVGEAEGSDQYFQLVDSYGLPLVNLSSTRFRRERGGGPVSRHREAYDAAVIELLPGYEPDICVLAGYMLIVSGAMCRRYPLLNLHPALPNGPTGAWQEVVWSLIESRAKQTGAMTHLATEEVDRGPVISYYTVPIMGECFDQLWRQAEQIDLSQARVAAGEEFPPFKLIRQAQYQREPYLLLETLRAVADKRVLIQDGAAFLGSNSSPLGEWGICLDAEIDRVMAEEGK